MNDYAIRATTGPLSRYNQATAPTILDAHELAGLLRTVQGKVILSGYPCPLYDELYGDWQCVTRSAFADGAKDRTEALWINHNGVVQQELWNQA